MEPLSTILPFSVNDPLPDVPNFVLNGWIWLGTRYEDMIRFILPLITFTFKCATLVTSFNDFSFFAEYHFYWSPKFFPKWITRSRNTLQRREKVHIEACKLYFQERYMWNLYQQFYIFGERSFTWSSKFLPKWINLSWNTLRRKDKVHIKAYNLYFQVRTLVTSINDFRLIVK